MKISELLLEIDMQIQREKTHRTGREKVYEIMQEIVRHLINLYTQINEDKVKKGNK